MISEGSCHTEDTDNSALPSQEYITFENILKYKAVILNHNNITVFLYYDLINAALVSIRDSFKKVLLVPNF